MRAHLDNIMDGAGIENKRDAEKFLDVCGELGLETEDDGNGFGFVALERGEYDNLYMEIQDVLLMRKGKKRAAEIERIKTNIATIIRDREEWDAVLEELGLDRHNGCDYLGPYEYKTLHAEIVKLMDLAGKERSVEAARIKAEIARHEANFMRENRDMQCVFNEHDKN